MLVERAMKWKERMRREKGDCYSAGDRERRRDKERKLLSEWSMETRE